MTSLSRHLVATDDHARLPFRRDCARCRAERLAGTLPDAAVIPARARAGIASALVVVSTAAPTPLALAGAPPPSVVPEAQGTLEIAAGESPEERRVIGPTPAPAPPAEAIDAEGPEPVGDGGADRVPFPPAPEDSGDVPSPPAGGPPQQLEDQVSRDPTAEGRHPLPPRPDTTPAPPAAHGDTDGRPTGDAVAQDPPSDPVSPAPPGDRTSSEPDLPARPSTPEDLEPAPIDGAAAAEETAPSPQRIRPPASSSDPQPEPHEEPVQPAEESGAAAGQAERPAKEVETVRRTSHEPSGSHRSTHVVDQGESLWVIAREALRADASNIETARYVSRIWDANAAAIGTGNPDLILPGQKLRMPS